MLKEFDVMIDGGKIERPESIASCIRTIYGATPENRPRVFVMMVRDARVAAKANYIDDQTLNDWLMDAAYGSELVQEVGLDQVQLLLAESTKPPPSPAINIYDFLARDFPPRDTMLTPWLPEQGLTMIHGPRGLGKTHVVNGVAWAVATGTGFLNWKAPKPRRVLMLDGEMPGVSLQERFRRITGACDTAPPDWDYLKIAAADTLPNGLPDLANIEVQKTFYAPLIADAEFVTVDNISTLCPNLRENEAADWTPIQNWALSLRRAGKSLFLCCHSGKTGAQRGTSRKEDVLDTVIGLRRPPDWSADQGARFEIHFEKNRGFYGHDAEPFEAQLTGEQWRVGSIKVGDDIETLQTLRNSGMTIRDISERTGVPRSTIHRRLEDCPAGQSLGMSRGTELEHRTNGHLGHMGQQR